MYQDKFKHFSKKILYFLQYQSDFGNFYMCIISWSHVIRSNYKTCKNVDFKKKQCCVHRHRVYSIHSSLNDDRLIPLSAPRASNEQQTCVSIFQVPTSEQSQDVSGCMISSQRSSLCLSALNYVDFFVKN